MPFKDPDEARAYYRQWKKSEAKRLSDKFYSAARHANRRAERYGVEGTITTADVRAILDGAACHYCGTDEGWMGLDHVIALAKGGPNVVENIVPACHSCNVKKRRGERVDKWSDEHEACVVCGLTERKHASHGKCRKCWHQEYDVGRYQLRKQRSSDRSPS